MILLFLLISDIVFLMMDKPTFSIQIIMKLSSNKYHQDTIDNSEFLIATTSAFMITAVVPYFLGRLMTKKKSAFTCMQIKNYVRIGVLIEVIITLVAAVATVICLSSVSFKSALVGAAFNICAGLIITTIAAMTWQSAENCTLTMIEFHEFLLNYKQTPRSKLLRRHLPPMEEVTEELS